MLKKMLTTARTNIEKTNAQLTKLNKQLDESTDQNYKQILEISSLATQYQEMVDEYHA